MKIGNVIFGKSISLALVNESDAQAIVDLRLDVNRNRFISVTSGVVEEQIQWLKRYKAREREGLEYYFRINNLTGEPIGLVRLYDFKESSFCWGSWVIKAGSPASAAIESALMVYDIGFYSLYFMRSHFDVRKGNSRVLAFHERMGARRTAETELDILFEYDEPTYKLAKDRYRKYIL